jgi:putative phosphoribosyl transferase
MFDNVTCGIVYPSKRYSSIFQISIMKILFEPNLNIPVASAQLKGDLTIPSDAEAIIAFAHGSGSSRLSPRNKMVSNYLVRQGLGTFLFDLLTPQEDQVFENRFDVGLLALRLVRATEWLEDRMDKAYRFGYFGASTGAAAALIASAALQQIGAVVSRGGRPDLVMEILPEVQAPTLLIVGSLDSEVLQCNENALAKLKRPKKLEIVPGASHLFEEKGTLDQVCIAAAAWFEKYLQPAKVLNNKLH